MGKIFLVMIVVLFFSNIFAKQVEENPPHFSKIQKLSLKIQSLNTLYYQYNKDDENQKTILNMIFQLNDPSKSDVLMDMVLYDIRNAHLYGQGAFARDYIRIMALTNIIPQSKYAVGFWYILKYEQSPELRIQTARMMEQLTNDLAVRYLVSLLRYNYFQEQFDNLNEKMVTEDRVAKAIITTLGEIGSPRALPILLQIVNIQNHLPETIEETWKSIKKLKMNNEGYYYFIESLEQAMINKTEQLHNDNLGQVNKTVKTLVNYVKENFNRYGYTADDIDIVLGIKND